MSECLINKKLKIKTVKITNYVQLKIIHGKNDTIDVFHQTSENLFIKIMIKRYNTPDV